MAAHERSTHQSVLSRTKEFLRFIFTPGAAGRGKARGALEAAGHGTPGTSEHPWN